MLEDTPVQNGTLQGYLAHRKQSPQRYLTHKKHPLQGYLAHKKHLGTLNDRSIEWRAHSWLLVIACLRTLVLRRAEDPNATQVQNMTRTLPTGLQGALFFVCNTRTPRLEGHNVYEPALRALLGTAAHLCKVVECLAVREETALRTGSCTLSHSLTFSYSHTLAQTLTRSHAHTLSHSDPLSRSHTLTHFYTRSHTLTHSHTLSHTPTLSHTLTLSHLSYTLTNLKRSNTLTRSHSHTLTLAHSHTFTPSHTHTLTLSHSHTLTFPNTGRS